MVIEPFEHWNLEARVTLRHRANWVFEAEYEFRFYDDFECFLPFVSNYFVEPTEPVIHLGGEWIQPKLSDAEHRFWARSHADAEVTRRVHHEGRREEHVRVRPIDGAFFDLPIMITPVGNGDYHVINVIEMEHCSSLSANRRWKAHDFALFRSDFAQGSTIRARAWLVVREMRDLDDALSLYEELTGA